MMTYSYYEHRLQEISDLLALGLEQVDPVTAKEFKIEREQILHELRHCESLPSSIQ